ncbi:hypothetical protein FGG08_001285 [Glutinoglossum americanum]|uniref:Alpha-ketoglutarate-dependent dioxygenase AlkB-like domain-containing protein n=1 Tax=Glutinoglossum americanum TaxID=1670608 RepID=A0A9P8L5G4_9PEZI|nr:hypothetical protein FGG08_001285 [Glutinoglossum americanum]
MAYSVLNLSCAKIQTWNCNRASPCNVCEKKGLICGERPWVPARGARPRPSSGPIADTQHARTPRPRKIRLKLSNPKEATMGEGNRPYPRGLPEVWSVGRQALCETLIYYRAYQSGAYTHDDLSFGFLVDKQCGERDYMDNEVVITRAGGGLKRNPETGEMEQVVDHNLKSKTVENFLNNKRNFCPVALIVGKGNPKCPTQIPFNYCVLGWFKVTDVWCEKIDGMKCFKFRFEKLDLELPSWWAPAGSPDPPRPYRYPKPAVRRTCNSCGESSPEIYIEGWICFTDNCESFWKINGAYPPANLHYNPAFLEERTRWPSKVKAPYSLKPAMLPEDRGNDSGYSVSHACWKGFSCPKCGRCNSREDWNGWECQTDECDYTYKVKRSILSAQAISNPHDPITDGHAISKDLISCPITEKVDFLENYRVHTYAITDCGTVTHFMANRTINERPDGPDDMFLALQQADIGLKRFPLKNSTLTGPMLAQHFAVNHGMPYKYVIDVDSKSFAEAPMTMHHARARLNWAGEYVVKDGSFRMFNELLTLGYFEKQKINYHDDGEEGLGPTIATLSLGGQATMTIRMKASHYHGVSRTGAYVDKHPPTKGCLNYEQRLLRHQEMEQLDPKMRSLLCKEIVKDLGLSRKRSSPVWLSMRLNHGDIVVMHGVKIQTYYEVRGALWKAVYGVLADRLCCQHAVEPHGKLRFAMTCRYIDPATVNSYHWWKADYENQDQIKAYDGDEFAKQQPISPPSSSPLPPSVQLVSSSPPPSPPLPPSSLPLHSPPPLPSPSSSLPPPIQLSPTLPSYHQEIASSQATKQISSQDP